ncbi:MAG: sigma-70 family RNA polymerase sigma factor [Chloroflexota bacterium]|nr:sigma-70 family RNA polymerase sigma factor [Chloroflexota bacterium]
MNALMATQPQQQDMEEIDLARQAITDIEAFAELYRRHLNRVYRYHIAHTGRVEDAEDLTSQTFVAALESIRSFRGAGTFAAWIMGIASRKRLMYFRGNKTELSLESAVHYPSSDPLTETLADERLQLQVLARALQQISPDRAEALVLTYFSGLSHAEAGRVLKKSEAAIKMLVARGLQDLRGRTSLSLEVKHE